MELFKNYIFISGGVAWAIAQILKIPWEYFKTKKWNWSLFFRPGGMPSSHSALVTGIAHSIGLHEGFGTPIFALAATLAIIVVYDATGIRRQAGKHAALINAMIDDLTSGHPLKGELLLEVLGHTPLEALAGVLLGLIVAQVGVMI
jgi:acid phosphatase family membrane protein YuiD